MRTLFLFLLMLLSFTSFSQDISTEQWNKLSGEAFLDFTQRGGTTDQYTANASKIIQDYIKRYYTFDNSGRLVRREQAQAQSRTSTGYFYSGQNMIGYVSNGTVFRGLNAVGLFNQGAFTNMTGSLLGSISGNKIVDPLNNPLITVSGGKVYLKGGVTFQINGSYLILPNGQQIRFTQMDMQNLGAYLMFF